jgi:hypothetical protein
MLNLNTRLWLGIKYSYPPTHVKTQNTFCLPWIISILICLKSTNTVVYFDWKTVIYIYIYGIRIRIRIRIFIIPINGPTIGANKLHTLIIVIGGNCTYIYIYISCNWDIFCHNKWVEINCCFIMTGVLTVNIYFVWLGTKRMERLAKNSSFPRF